MFPLSAHALYRQPLDLADGRLVQASLFPLFDEKGKVHQLLLIKDEPASLALLKWRPGLVRKPFFGPVQLTVPGNSLWEASAEAAEEATFCWHYDPWWTLKEDHLARHPAAAALGHTNAVPELENVSSLHYARDLSQIQWVTESTGDSVRMVGFGQGRLPPRQVVTNTRPGPPAGWCLRPFWLR